MQGRIRETIDVGPGIGDDKSRQRVILALRNESKTILYGYAHNALVGSESGQFMLSSNRDIFSMDIQKAFQKIGYRNNLCKVKCSSNFERCSLTLD